MTGSERNGRYEIFIARSDQIGFDWLGDSCSGCYFMASTLVH